MKSIIIKLLKEILNFNKKVPWQAEDVRDLGVKSYRRKNNVIDALKIKKYTELFKNIAGNEIVPVDSLQNQRKYHSKIALYSLFTTFLKLQPSWPIVPVLFRSFRFLSYLAL